MPALSTTCCSTLQHYSRQWRSGGGGGSSSETSLFSLNKLQLEQMRRNDNHRITLIERMLSEPHQLIVTNLIGNEFVNVAASVIPAAIVIQLFGADNKMVNLLIMVPIQLLVDEITPKQTQLNTRPARRFHCWLALLDRHVDWCSGNHVNNPVSIDHLLVDQIRPTCCQSSKETRREGSGA
ncbi:MAG: DUF21 domain-containing protein [gamma proteobacterium endosymbiont of Lamellibrachia anaximandri]|nr:DUF21 domain-containing protein [gamma proteobacterium endosymbiont of Lamellibrachia anaximandri]